MGYGSKKIKTFVLDGPISLASEVALPNLQVLTGIAMIETLRKPLPGLDFPI